MKRKKRWVVAAATILTYLLWPASVKPAILRAYSDNAFGIWALTLYQDGSFDMSLPAFQETGSFRLMGDTIVLQYNEPVAGAPAAYLINQDKQRIDELEKVAGRWILQEPANNWVALEFDSTRHYAPQLN